MRAEFFADYDRVFATIGELQAAVNGWVSHYNTERPHQSLGMCPPADRFALAAGPDLEVVEPVAAVATNGQNRAASQRADLRSAGVRRWVNQRGSIRLAGFGYRVPIVLAGEPVEAVVADNWVQIYHRDVLVASHAQRQALWRDAAAAMSGSTHRAGGH
jgi:Integrase core domain